MGIILTVHVGSIPISICLVTHLTNLQMIYNSSNPGIKCAPLCVSSVTSRTVPSTICVFPQDNGLCGLLAATNIHSISGYSQWSCATGGYTSTLSCLSPLWPGVTCNGVDVVGINLLSLGITGM